MENNDEHNINYEYITRYIRRTLRPKDGLLGELEQYAARHDVPISQPETIQLIQVLLRAMKAQSVLEIGAAIGYSAIAMAQCGCTVTTVERDQTMLEQLHKNIGVAGLGDRIAVVEGDATEVLPQLQGQYDLIFIDAAKAQYNEFLPNCLRLLRTGGVLLSDNVLYKGRVATDELFLRRKITIIKRLRHYLNELCSNEALDTAILPIGDGVALSYFRATDAGEGD